MARSCSHLAWSWHRRYDLVGSGLTISWPSLFRWKNPNFITGKHTLELAAGAERVIKLTGSANTVILTNRTAGKSTLVSAAQQRGQREENKHNATKSPTGDGKPACSLDACRLSNHAFSHIGGSRNLLATKFLVVDFQANNLATKSSPTRNLPNRAKQVHGHEKSLIYNHKTQCEDPTTIVCDMLLNINN
jgi:hypothetical protein